MTTNQNHQSLTTRALVVCPTCKGHGTTGPGHVFTQDDLDEQFGPDQFEVMADYRRGAYDIVCPECVGLRVVRAECACAECEIERHEIAEMHAEMAAERAMGC